MNSAQSFCLPFNGKEAEQVKHFTLSARSSLALVFAASAAMAQTAGHASFLEYTQPSFDAYTDGPNTAQQQWLQTHFGSMVVYSPYFDSRTWWFPNAYFYQDLYGIPVGSWIQYAHPDWILHDAYGNWLYIPYNCNGGTCPQWAGDIANPAFRAFWISQAASSIANGGYPGIFIDDANMEFRVSDGWGNQVAPTDSNTGTAMTYDGWRSYVASFVEQIHGAFPTTKLIENTIWFAGPAGIQDADPYIQRQIATATTINLERGVASDSGLTGGTGQWSVYAFLNYVDRVHAAGKNINFEEYGLDPAGQQYGLASYFLISGGADSLGDQTTTPDDWWSGYDVNLGTPLGPRTYNNGVFQRNFSGGIVLLGEPGLSPQTINLGGTYTLLDGTPVSSVTISGGQGIILQGATGGAVTRYVSDLTPYYVVNGWGTMQKDLSILGYPLIIDGVQYAKGLGVHAYSELRYALSGNCTLFTATAGIDDEVPPGTGWVDFQVWADGYLLYDSGFVTSGSPAHTMSVDLTGRQSLGLVVTNGIYMAPVWTVYNDHADWANAKVTCND